jgi:uncharacterized protein (TIGR02246 family)
VTGAISAEDRLAITELFARYGWCFDSGDTEAFAALFTPSATYELDGGRRFVGHEQISGYLAQAAASSWFPGRQHHVDQIVIDGTADRATARSYCTVTQRSAEGGTSLVYLGWYADVCVKIDGRWLFESRTVRNWNSDQVRVGGTLHN